MEFNDKIVFFLPNLDGGGAEKIMLNLAKSLSKNINIDLVVGNVKGQYVDLLSEDINIVNLNCKKMIFCLPKFMKYILKNRPNTILATLSTANIIAILTKILMRALLRSSPRVIIRIPNHLSSQLSNENKFKTKIILKFAIFLYRFSDEIIAISNGVAKDIVETIGFTKKKIKVIYNPVVNDELYKLSLESISDNWFDTNQSDPIIISVGRLTKQKDFPTLIEAIEKVLLQKSVKLIILGEGEDREKLEKLIKDKNLSQNIRLIGFVKNPYKYMKKADLFVLSSAWEGFGNVIVEALACGTPVISTNCRSGPSEILEDGKYGKLVPVGDSDKMAESIIESLEKDHTTNKLINRANQFKLNTIKEEYLKVLKDNRVTGEEQYDKNNY